MSSTRVPRLDLLLLLIAVQTDAYAFVVPSHFRGIQQYSQKQWFINTRSILHRCNDWAGGGTSTGDTTPWTTAHSSSNHCRRMKVGIWMESSSSEDSGNSSSSRSSSGGGTPPQPPRRPKGPNARMKIFQWLNRPSVEVLSTLAVLLSSFLVALDTTTLPSFIRLPASSDPHLVIEDVLQIINAVFAIDFFVRWYAAGNFKTRYLTKPLVTLDILVVLIPLFLGGLLPYLATVGIAGPDGLLPTIPAALQFDSAGLQNLLLLRILRLRRVLTDINTFARFEIALGLNPRDVRPYQLQLARVLLSVFTLLSVASGLIYSCEHEVNPEIPDYFAALYFGLTTLTTVGFGDIAPITPEGRLVVCLSILAGISVIPAQAAKLVDALAAYQEEVKKGGPRVTVRAGSAVIAAKKTTRETLGRVSSIQLRAEAAAAAADSKNVKEKEREAPVLEVTKSVATPIQPLEGKFEGWLGRCCLVCEAQEHREDANYCWSCGTKL